MSPKTRSYRWRDVPVVAGACGLVVGLLTLWSTHHTLGPAIAGAATAVAVGGLWAFRVLKQDRGARGEVIPRTRFAFITVVAILGILVAVWARSVAVGAIVAIFVIFWSILVLLHRRRASWTQR